MNSSQSYSGKEVYVGIDVHAKKYVVSCVVGKEEVAKCTMSAEPEEVVKYLKGKFGKAKSINTAYEASFCGYCLHRTLESGGIKNIVVSPASIEIAPSDRVKTDKRDALKIAKLHSVDRLEGIYVPSEQEQFEREAQRTRSQLVDHRKSIMNQIRGKLRFYGLLPHDATGVLTIKTVQKCIADAAKEIVMVIKTLLVVWETLNEQIAVLMNEIKEQSGSIDELLQSVPGIGPLTARILVSELVTMERFRSSKSLASFVGLTPSEHSSGEKVAKGGITRRGSTRLRQLLVQSAWVAVGRDPDISEWYGTLRVRMSAQKAIIAVARKLLLIARALWKTKKLYQRI